MSRRRIGARIFLGCDTIPSTLLLILSVCLSSLLTAAAACFFTTLLSIVDDDELPSPSLLPSRRLYQIHEVSYQLWLSNNYYSINYRSRRYDNLLRLSLSSSSSSNNNHEDIYAAIHRKKYEMKRLNPQHAS